MRTLKLGGLLAVLALLLVLGYTSWAGSSSSSQPLGIEANVAKAVDVGPDGALMRNQVGESAPGANWMTTNLVYTRSVSVPIVARNSCCGNMFWELAGNAGTDPSTNFLGTIDDQPLVIKTNGNEAVRVGQDGALMTDQIGELVPDAGLALGSDLRFNGYLHLGASYIVYTQGTTVYALNGETGAIDFQGPDAAAVIRSTLAEDRHVIITAGRYVITSPIDLVSHLRLELEDAAILEVPNGYDSYVFGLGGDGPPKFGVHHTHIEGGTIREECSDRYFPPPDPLLPQRLWTAILLHVEQDGGGVMFNTIRDIDIWDAGTAIKLLIQAPCTDTGWINGNGFQSLHINDPIVFIDFAVDGVPEEEAYFDGNYFEDIMGSIGQAETEFGLKDLRGQRNLFMHVLFWDIHHSPSSISARILPTAKDTIILGGMMTHWNFEDNGIRTQIIDKGLDRQLFVDELTIGHPPTTPGYRIWAQEDGLYLEYVNTHTVYRLLMEPVTWP